MCICKFSEAWVGTCNNSISEGEFCSKHLEIKCSICGKQATHTCEQTTVVVCGTPLCDDLECKLKHFYTTHNYAINTIHYLETDLKKVHSDIVFSKITYGNTKLGNLLNNLYKNKYMPILITYGKNNEVTLNHIHSLTDLIFYSPEKIQETLSEFFYKKYLDFFDLYLSEDIIDFSKKYDKEFVSSLKLIKR